MATAAIARRRRKNIFDDYPTRARPATRRSRLCAMVFRDPAPASPWQNGFAEQLIGSIRRECVDHCIVLGEGHLRRILRSYARYYNDIRTHRSLDKDALVSRPVQRTGIISSRPILGGLHHHYVRD
jgi:transposase InsO family protein